MDTQKNQNTPIYTPMHHFIKYVVVGGVSTLVDMGTLLLFTTAGLHYLCSACIGFLTGLSVNYMLSKKFVFTQQSKVNKTKEFLFYGLIGLIGLLLTILLMYLCTDIFKIHYLFSKVIVAIIVLGWNYGARKQFLYKKEESII